MSQGSSGSLGEIQTAQNMLTSALLKGPQGTPSGTRTQPPFLVLGAAALRGCIS